MERSLKFLKTASAKLQFKINTSIIFNYIRENEPIPRIKISNDLKISWLSMNRVTEMIKELETYGFLKCKYARKGLGQIKYVDIFQPSEIPRYVSVLREELHRTPPPHFPRNK